MITVIELMFWSAVGLLGVTWIGYPVAVALLARVSPWRWREGAGPPPEPVTVVIPLHNEEVVIEAKIAGALSLGWPGAPPTVVLVDDASTDGSASVCRRAVMAAGGRVQYLRSPERIGKNRALNLALRAISDGVVVFTDANAFFEPDALEELMKPFSDPAVGCVAGRLQYLRSGSHLEGAYWRLEDQLKAQEGALGRLVIAAGPIFAARRALIRPMHPAVSCDLQVPLMVLEAGARSVFNPRAVAHELMTATSVEEMHRKVRIMTQSFTGLGAMLRLARGVTLVQFVFHKVLRWATGLWVAVACGASVILALHGSPLFQWILAAQLGLLALAPVGLMLERMGRGGGPLSLPWHVLSMCVAGLWAQARALRGQTMASWEKPASTRDVLPMGGGR